MDDNPLILAADSAPSLGFIGWIVGPVEKKR